MAAEVNPNTNIDGTALDAKDIWTKALLDDTTEAQKIQVIRLLLDQRADINVSDENGITPLHVASMIGCSTIVEELLNQGACVNSKTRFNQCHLDKNNYTPLHYAVENGRHDIVNLLLRNNADIGNETSSSPRPLHIAVRKGHLDIAEELLNHGASINKSAPETEHSTELHYAAEQGNEEIVKFLVSRGAHINIRDLNNLTPLYYATEKQHEGIVKVLLENGAKIDTEDKKFKMLLFSVAVKGNSIILEHFLKYYPEVTMIRDTGNNTLLHTAVGFRQLEVVELLLKYGADVNPKDIIAPIYGTVRYSSNYRGGITIPTQNESIVVQIFNLLVSRGADINVSRNDQPLLHYAVHRGAEEIVLLLLENNVDVNSDDNNGMSALAIAARNGHVNMVANLLKHGARVDSVCTRGECRGYTPLHFAAASFHNISQIVKLLLDKGANSNACAENDVTPIYCAIKRGGIKMLELLLKHGAELNVKNKNFVDSMHYAIQNDRINVIKFILESYPDVISFLCRSDCTFLHIAIQKDVTMREYYYSVKVFEIVELFLNYMANVDSRDEYGKTALHIACIKGYSKVVTLLLDHRADINITSTDGETVLHYAIKNAHSKGHASNTRADHNFTIMLLVQHILKMKALNSYLSDQILAFIGTNDFTLGSGFEMWSTKFDIPSFYARCKAEVANMKEEIIRNSNVSFYTVLTNQKGTHCANHTSARNESLAQALESGYYRVKFPLYSKMMDHSLHRAQNRKILLYHCLNYSNFVLKCKLPAEIIEEIFSYLSNYDLRSLIDINPDSHSREMIALLLPWKVKKISEADDRRRRRNNVIIKNLMLNQWGVNSVHEDIKSFLEILTERNIELDEVRELREDDTYLVRFKELKEKLYVMNAKKALKGSKVLIDHDFTEKEKIIQDKLNERAVYLKMIGKSVKVGYMKMWINNKEYKWDEEAGVLKKLENDPEH